MADQTSTKIHCPNCARPIDTQSRYCEHCGVDLAVAAVLAERTVHSEPHVPSGAPLAPEILVPRMGEYLIEQGVLSHEGLQEALDHQSERARQGKSILVGQALLELGLVDRETLDQVITTQILQLQHALNDANRQLERRVRERTLDLQRALDRLAELNQLKSNFIANVSHELRTPLTHIKGYLDLLGDHALGSLSREQEDAIEVMQRAEDRLEGLIEDLIQFSLATRGELSLNLDTVSLQRLAVEAGMKVRSDARTKEIKLTIHAPDELPPAYADGEKLAWVLQQLIDNAVKFTPESGRVVVEVSRDGSRLQVAVSDTGIGIPEDAIAQVFEPFHQMDGSTTRRFGGTGLGLAMVRRIVEAHGSQVEVQSRLNEGTRFVFSLPIAKTAKYQDGAGREDPDGTSKQPPP